MKKYHQQNRLQFNLTIVLTNLIQIGLLVTKMQNFRKDVRLILYTINLLRKV